jgi:hypothetical protein
MDSTTGKTDPAAAVRLYEHNSRLTTAAWSSISDVEIVLRNVVADAISAHHDTVRANPPHRWYDDPSWFAAGNAWLTTKTISGIRTAMGRVGDPGPSAGARPGPGKVVAELTLGFWRYLLIARYEHSLWNPAIRSKFPGLSHLSGSDSRKEAHRRVEALNYLRNRVAHHEPIYEAFAIPGRPQPLVPDLVLREAVELISWNNAGAATWISSRDDFQRLWRQGPQKDERRLRLPIVADAWRRVSGVRSFTNRRRSS